MQREKEWGGRGKSGDHPSTLLFNYTCRWLATEGAHKSGPEGALVGEGAREVEVAVEVMVREQPRQLEKTMGSLETSPHLFFLPANILVSSTFLPLYLFSSESQHTTE